MPVCLDYSCVVKVRYQRPQVLADLPSPLQLPGSSSRDGNLAVPILWTKKEPDTRRAVLDTMERRDAVYAIGGASVRMSGSPRRDAPRLRRSRDEAL